MSHEDAVAAIQAASEAEAQGEADNARSFVAGTPAGETEPEVQPEAPEAPEASAVEPELVEPEALEDTFDGGQFNPDELPEELQPGWKQLQGAWTRKTQEFAGTLKEAEAFLSLGVDAETTGHAVDLYDRINDPSNWPALYEQLGQAMTQNGIQVPGPTATPAPASPAPSVDDAQLDALVENDPDLAPLVATLKAQRAELARVDSLQARLDAQETEALAAREEAQQLRQYQVELGRIEAEEAQIREAFPTYKQEDVDMVYELSSFHNGDLVQAQERLENYVQGRVTAALAGKGRPKTAARPALTQKMEAPKADETIFDIGEEAAEHLRTLQRAGELDI